jgi:hypothetical protein
MLGEKIGDFSGKTTSMRALPSNGGGPVLEVSVTEMGKLIGLEGTDHTTYTATMLPSGFIRGEGQGFFMTKDGESATWRGYGRGRPAERGGVSWRGCLFYNTTSQKLARLNGLCVAFEFDMDDQGASRGTLYEWR